MSEHYDFHYQPTGSGAISGQQVLEQTEDAINELGDYVNDNVGGAMDVAQQALETAQNAEQDAQTALDTANSFSSAIQSAQQDASTALSTAQTAQATASNANNTAIQASQDASSAVTTANNASGQVSTLSGTVTALGQRVTTAEGNIGQNTSDITALTTRVGTAEGNITTLQNDVTIAQGNASSAMATAGTVKQQSYVLRYSSSSVTDNSTIAYSTLDNTDNIKSGDKVIDVDGKIFSVVSVDTANQTVTVGSALIDLAQDSDVVHKSGNETKSGELTLSSTLKSSDIVPLANLTFNLGTPDYKYNNVYAYMYNSIGRYFGNEATSNQRTNITLYANRDTQNQSCAYITRFRQNRAQGALQPTDLQKIGFDVLENEVRTNNVFDIQCTDWLNDIPQKVYLISSVQSYSFGRSSVKALINDLNPSSLGMPDLSNGIDISSYITIGNTDNNYTPPANGWIWIRLIGNGATITQGDFGINANYVTEHLTQEKWVETNLFVTKDVQATIRCRTITGIVGAKFYPCQGNV